jgi:hypothetical protein
MLIDIDLLTSSRCMALESLGHEETNELLYDNLNNTVTIDRTFPRRDYLPCEMMRFIDAWKKNFVGKRGKGEVRM